MHILGSIYWGSYGEREGKFTDIRVHELRILWREGGGVCKYQGPYIGDPMERGGGVAHIRVHLLRIIWREGGGFAHNKFNMLKILLREEERVHTY